MRILLDVTRTLVHSRKATPTASTVSNMLTFECCSISRATGKATLSPTRRLGAAP